MARTTTAKKEIDPVETPNEEIKSVVAQKIEQPLNLEQQVTVRSIAGWDTGFTRILTIGDVKIPSKGSIRLSRNEIISQVHDNNPLFNGLDGKGSHATYIIEDDVTLEEVGFDPTTQFSDENVKRLFNINSQDEFEYRIREQIVTRAEKYALMISIVKQKLNDFSKIRFCENYTGYRIDKVAEEENR